MGGAEGVSTPSRVKPLSCHRKKLDNISKYLTAAADALHALDLRIVNVDGKNLLSSGVVNI